VTARPISIRWISQDGDRRPDPDTQGTLGVQYAYDWLTGKKSAVPQPQKYTPLRLITQANVASYIATRGS
jgi:hypothetical protein